jgi:hypothetical protein
MAGTQASEVSQRNFHLGGREILHDGDSNTYLGILTPGMPCRRPRRLGNGGAKSASLGSCFAHPRVEAQQHGNADADANEGDHNDSSRGSVLIESTGLGSTSRSIPAPGLVAGRGLPARRSAARRVECVRFGAMCSSIHSRRERYGLSVTGASWVCSSDR